MNFKKPSRKSGIYLLLLEDGSITYIGMSKNMCGRILQHAANDVIDFSACITLPFSEIHLPHIESFLINRVKPSSNKAKVEVRDDSEICFQYVTSLISRVIFGDDHSFVFKPASNVSKVSPIVDGMYVVSGDKAIASIDGQLHFGPVVSGYATRFDDFDHDTCAELLLTPLDCNSGTIKVLSRFRYPVQLAAHLASAGRAVDSLLHFEIDALSKFNSLVVDFDNEYVAIDLLVGMLTDSLREIGLVSVAVDSKYHPGKMNHGV